MGAYGGLNARWTTDIEPETPPVPKELAFIQNYPNPFNAQTTIDFTLSDKGPVRLAIYNLLGQEVAVLVYGYQEIGDHRAIWDASSFPSGIYFARLESGEQIKTTKMILLK